jgi:phage terminase large subunit-like protein
MPTWEPGYGHGGRLRWAGVPAAAGHTTAAGASVEALAFSAAKPDRIRGPEIGFLWGDEIAAWGTNGQAVHDLLNPGLRIGTHPRAVYTSTPKPTAFVEYLHRLAEDDLELEPRKRVYIERVFSTWSNRANLPASTIDELLRRYGGTTQGRQELDGELLVGDPEAMWSQHVIDAAKVTPSEVPEIVRAVVAVDNATTSSPPGTIDERTIEGRNRDVGSNDTGIGAALLGADGDVYIPTDNTINAGPKRWGERVLETFADCWRGRRADLVVVEKNGGGELIRRNLDVCMSEAGIPPAVVPIRWVTAKDGKILRADPVVALYEQGRVHHIHRPMTAPGAITPLADLEYQMTRFKAGRTGYKKDRVDWLVYAVTALITAPGPGDRRKKAASRAAVYVS